ncbi:uncharacterized protein LOC127007893 [Eriocheir sinensis]|uniref:uncharacterized protein LOC127007893 n=1 Tax=Eriocheir sinensis TaxID=95602 RepID=UPI0021CA7F08|nr:uncharacterized protein LOC127007893 [Eriocheir sinensis]
MCGLRSRPDDPPFRMLLLTILLLLLTLPSGECLRCVNCTSLKDPECLDGIGSEEQCATDQTYCVSYIGFLKMGQAQVLFRACTETNMSHFCGVHFEKLTNNRVERLMACYRTCTTDLCNVHRMEYLSAASPTPSSSPTLVLLLTFGLLSLAVRRFLVT